MIRPIQIKRRDIVEAAQELATLTGVSMTDAIGNAVKAQLTIEQVKASAKLSKRWAVNHGLEELRQLPVVGRKLMDKDLYGM